MRPQQCQQQQRGQPQSHPVSPPGLLFESFKKGNPGFRSFKQQTFDVPLVTPQPRAVLRAARGELQSPPAPPSPANTFPLMLPYFTAAKALPTIPRYLRQRNWFKSHVHNPVRRLWAQRSDPSARQKHDREGSPKSHQSAGRGMTSADQQQTIARRFFLK